MTTGFAPFVRDPRILRSLDEIIHVLLFDRSYGPIGDLLFVCVKYCNGYWLQLFPWNR